MYPSVGDRSSPNDWVEQGRPSVVERAARKLETILANHYPYHIPESVDAAIRERLPIRLPRVRCGPPARFSGARIGDRRRECRQEFAGDSADIREPPHRPGSR